MNAWLRWLIEPRHHPSRTVRHHVILNPAAGRGRAGRLLPSLRATLRQQLPDHRLYITTRQGEAAELAEQLRDSAPVVVAAGGDGTIHEVVNGLMGGRAILGLIPVGSGNDFIKMLNLPQDVAAAVSVVKRGRHKPVDIGEVNGRYFPNGVGMGFDAEAVRVGQKVKWLRGFLIYFYSVLRTMLFYRNREVTIRIGDRETRQKIFMISVGNGASVGGGFRITPDARLDDGLFDICIMDALSRVEILRHLPKAIQGRHKHLPQVDYFRAAEMTVLAVNGIPVHADGELLGEALQEIRIRLIPGALRVIYNGNEV